MLLNNACNLKKANTAAHFGAKALARPEPAPASQRPRRPPTCLSAAKGGERAAHPSPSEVPAILPTDPKSTWSMPIHAIMDRLPLVVCTWDKPSRPLRVVITGGSRGIGKALAREFLSAGDAIFLAGTTDSGVAAAVAALKKETGPCADVEGFVADVGDPDSVEALAEAATRSMGGVDVWLNNAGYSGSFQASYVGCNSVLSSPPIL
jgi:hypothetical protein